MLKYNEGGKAELEDLRFPKSRRRKVSKHTVLWKEEILLSRSQGRGQRRSQRLRGSKIGRLLPKAHSFRRAGSPKDSTKRKGVKDSLSLWKE